MIQRERAKLGKASKLFECFTGVIAQLYWANQTTESQIFKHEWCGDPTNPLKANPFCKNDVLVQPNQTEEAGLSRL